jgi:hypothetical protein
MVGTSPPQVAGNCGRSLFTGSTEKALTGDQLPHILLTFALTLQLPPGEVPAASQPAGEVPPGGVESTAGAVAVGRGVRCFRRLSPFAGASVLTLAPFPAAAHRTGLAALPHPALGRASREGMRGPSSQARVVDVDHSHLSMDLGMPEAAGSADAQLVPPAEEPPYSFLHMPADRIIGLTGETEAEVLGPSRQESVEPSSQLGPGRGISPGQQGVDLLLQPLLGFLRGPC